MAAGVVVLVCSLLAAPAAAHPDADAMAAAQRGPATVLWVDPVNGDDANAGSSRDSAVRTVTEAWGRIPAGITLGDAGFVIRLVDAEYGADVLPVYWEDRHGTEASQIRVEGAEAGRGALLRGHVSLFNVEHVSFHGLTLANSGDVLHCEQCRHLTVRDCTLSGGNREAHETVKVNQSQFVTLEDNDIGGSYENAIDFVAVQHAVIRGNRIHDADDWCAYVKGGSAYITVEGNAIFNCGVGGFTAGQGTGFEYMTPPWLHYEAYDVRVVNNLIYDTDGAGLGVNGGFAVLLAHNTLYRVGRRSHLIEVAQGSRSCDGENQRCAEHRTAGGWGPVHVGWDEAQPIPNRHVYVYNNLVVNPLNAPSQWQHLTIAGPAEPAPDSGVPSPARADDDLRIAGNVVWNGPADHPLGIGDDTGCQPSNPTCTGAQVLAGNTINLVAPVLTDPDAGDLHALNAAELPPPLPIPSFPPWQPLVPPVPAGRRDTAVPVDAAGAPRSGRDAVGAYALDSVPAPPARAPRRHLRSTARSGP